MVLNVSLYEIYKFVELYLNSVAHFIRERYIQEVGAQRTTAATTLSIPIESLEKLKP